MSNEIEKSFDTADTEQTYSVIRNSVISAQNKIYSAVNSAMVQAYWEIGEQIYIACGENDRAEYGKGLLNLGRALQLPICVICGSSILHIQFATHCVAN